MKTVIALALIFALCGIASSQSNMEEMKKIGLTCLEEGNVDGKDFQSFVNGEIKLEDAPENLKCAMKCLMEKNGFTTAAGEFSTEGYKAKYDPSAKPDVMNRVIEACKDIKDSNPCDTAFMVSRCILKNLH